MQKGTLETFQGEGGPGNPLAVDDLSGGALPLWQVRGGGLERIEPTFDSEKFEGLF